jgi:hypothetical protein
VPLIDRSPEAKERRRDALRHLFYLAVLAGLTYLGARPPAAPNVHVAPQVQPPPVALPPIQFEQPAPPRPAEPKPDTPAAIARIQFGTAGCTATVIGPRRPDGRWWVLTASHCVNAVGQHGQMRLKDGRATGIVVAALDRRADCCWCVTESNSDAYPFALLAPSSPPPGSRVWHAGYGVDTPGNREDGAVEAGPDQNGQLRFRLNVSSGDSGGGVCLDENGLVVSCVCCTTAKGQVAQVWGASPEAIARTKPTEMALDDWTPVEIPRRDPVPVPDEMPARR